MKTAMSQFKNQLSPAEFEKIDFSPPKIEFSSTKNHKITINSSIK